MLKIQKQYVEIELVKAIKNHDQQYINRKFINDLKDYRSPHTPHDPLVVIAVEADNVEMVNKLLAAKVNLTQNNLFAWNLFHTLTLYNIPNKQKWVSLFIPQKIPYPSHAIHAAVRGELEYFNQYLNNNQTYHLTQKEPLTQLQPIHYAAANGHRDIVRLLIKMNPSLAYAKCARGNTPVHFAALNRHIDIVKEILEMNQVNSHVLRNKYYDTIGYHAAYGNSYKILDYLAKNYPDFLLKSLSDILYVGLNSNEKLLMWITANLKREEIKPAINETRISNLPLLHYAIYFLNNNACIWLTQHGADLLSYNQFGKNALDIAAEQLKSDLFHYMCRYQQIKNKLSSCVKINLTINLFRKDYDTSFIQAEFVSLKELAASKLIHIQDKLNLNEDCNCYFNDLKISNMNFHKELEEKNNNQDLYQTKLRLK